jgi:hypothetical protein
MSLKNMIMNRMQTTGERLRTFNLAIAEEENTIYIGNRETIFRFALPE